MNAKTDCLGNPVILHKNEVRVFHKDTGKLKSITCFTNAKNAKQEFNRMTNSYRGCGRNIYMKHPCAMVFYGQLIING